LDTLNESIKHAYDLQSKSNEVIQNILVACTYFALTDTNVTPYKTLLDSVRGADRKALLTWVHNNGLAKFDKLGAVILNKGRYKSFKAENYTLAQLKASLPFWVDFTPTIRNIVASFDVEARIQSVINSANEKIASKETVKNAELLTFIKNAVEHFHSIQREKLIQTAKVDEIQLVTGKHESTLDVTIEREEA
jgi:hypothetical protein